MKHRAGEPWGGKVKELGKRIAEIQAEIAKLDASAGYDSARFSQAQEQEDQALRIRPGRRLRQRVAVRRLQWLRKRGAPGRPMSRENAPTLQIPTGAADL